MSFGPYELFKRPFVLPACGYVFAERVNALECACGLVHLDAGEDRAESSHRSEVGRYYVVLFIKLQYVLECLPDALVRGDAALERDRRDELLALADGCLEVPGDSVTEPGHYVVVRGRYLLQVDHVALCKYRAPSRDPRRVLALQCEMSELFYCEAHPEGLLVEERARACCADRVHLEIRYPELLIRAFRRKEDELGVLAAHLDHSPCLGMVYLCRLCLGNDLVGKARADKRRDELSA